MNHKLKIAIRLIHMICVSVIMIAGTVSIVRPMGYPQEQYVVSVATGVWGLVIAWISISAWKKDRK